MDEVTRILGINVRWRSVKNVDVDSLIMNSGLGIHVIDDGNLEKSISTI